MSDPRSIIERIRRIAVCIVFVPVARFRNGERTPLVNPTAATRVDTSIIIGDRMSKSAYRYMAEQWHKPREGYMNDLRWKRLIEWRKEPTFVRVDKPLRIARARTLGYKAKQGYVVVRTRVRRGGQRRPQIKSGRRAKRTGISKITMEKNIQRIAEERTQRHYPNLEVLNSYWVADDGKHKYFEVILVDPHHPVIRSDPNINWICEPRHRNRVFRGKTAAGKRGRGLYNRGRGAEKLRPSFSAKKNKNRGK